MITVVAIIGILSTILIVNQKNFNTSNILVETAYTVALSVREMQSFGLSSRAFTSTTSTVTPNAGYGIHFGDDPTYYDTFADIYPAVGATTDTSYCTHGDVGTPAQRPGNCVYDQSAPVSEQVQRYTFKNGYTISKVCYAGSHGVPSCNPFPGTSIDIVYERPNNQAIITYTVLGSVNSTTKAAVELTSPQGGMRCVVMTQIGEVYVTASDPMCT